VVPVVRWRMSPGELSRLGSPSPPGEAVAGLDAWEGVRKEMTIKQVPSAHCAQMIYKGG
jgi:hypothetical protein